METKPFAANKWITIISGILILIGLYLTTLYNYLLFHSIAEVFIIVVASGIFILAWNSRRFLDNNYLLFIGVAYLFIAVLELIHTLGYVGMGIFKGYGTNLPTQLWIAARYMESLSLLIAPLFFGRRIRLNILFITYASAICLIFLSIFLWNIFPVCFVEETGLTPFKKISEYIICLILLGAIALLFQKRKEFEAGVYRFLIASILLAIAAELTFTFYIHAYGFSNLIGHYFTIISFYFIYKAIIETGMVRPYSLLFRNLKQNEDALRESEKRQRQIIENSNAGYFFIDREGRFQQVNTAWLHLHKYETAEEIIGQHFSLTQVEAELPNAHDTVKQLLDGREIISGEFSRRCKDGSIGYHTFTARAVEKEGVIIGLEGFIIDITERKQAEEALRKGNERFSDLTDSLPQIVYEADKKGTLTYINRDAFEYFGYTESEFDKKLNILQMISPEDRDRAVENIQKVLNGEILGGVKYTALRKDGSTFPVEIHSKAFFRDDKPIGLRGIIIDLRDSKKAEEALLKSEATLKSIFKATPTGIGLVRNRVFKEVNDRLCEMVGYSRKELLDKNARVIYPTDEEYEYVGREKYKQIGETGTGTVETRFQRKDGKVISVLLSSTQLNPDDLSEGAVFTALDITERKQFEETLKESEERYRSMMEAMKDGSYICSPELRIEYMNPAMIDRVGRDATGELCHKAIYDRDKKCSWCIFDPLQQKKHVEYEMADPKDNRYYSVTSSPISHTDGTVSKLTIFRDITEIKTMEGSLRQAQKMESIGTLTGGIAHDFNNILGIIVGNTELALDDVPEWNPVHSNLEEIKTASLRATNIVKQLLSFSRKTDQKLHPIEIALVIKDALKFLRSTIPTTIDIQQDIQATDETVLADPSQINQVLMNLCINASQAMAQTGGNLTVNMEEVILDDALSKDYPDLRSGKHIKVTVCDTGPGIDPEIIDRIFDPYFTTKEVGKGSGMGLAVVHGIVKSHNGAIFVDSKPGKGTTFSILFPVVTETPKIEKDTTEKLLLGSETVLFVDDEKPIIKAAQKMLERLGYQVETKMNPVEALEQFQSKPDQFDLVITDMTMPQMTGVMLSEKIMEIRPDIPVIICTGHSVLIDEKRAKQLGIAAYVMKPITMREIAKTIRKVLDEAKSSAHD